eukprot:2314930-Pyramimonas_sp.AAC.2
MVGQMRVELEGPVLLWTAEEPNLYLVVVTLKCVDGIKVEDCESCRASCANNGKVALNTPETLSPFSPCKSTLLCILYSYHYVKILHTYFDTRPPGGSPDPLCLDTRQPGGMPDPLPLNNRPPGGSPDPSPSRPRRLRVGLPERVHSGEGTFGQRAPHHGGGGQPPRALPDAWKGDYRGVHDQGPQNILGRIEFANGHMAS